MLSALDPDVLHHIRDEILRAAGDTVERIVFYGSQATGRARPTSDYDILVVLRDPVTNWVEESMRLSDLFNTFDHPVDVQVFGETEFVESRPVAGTIAVSRSQRWNPSLSCRLKHPIKLSAQLPHTTRKEAERGRQH